MKSKYIDKNIFIESSANLLMALTELVSRKYIDAVLRRGFSEIHALPASVKSILNSSNATAIVSMGEPAFKLFTVHLEESYVVLGYSWLETYLSVVEEALYLNDPKSLGDNLQIKLGKILEIESILELIHDAVRRRLREKSSWGLKNRVADLRELYHFDLAQDNAQLEDISRIRNDIVHNKKIGEIAVVDGRVRFVPKEKIALPTINSSDYLDKVSNLAIDLFFQSCKLLNIDKRNKGYRKVCDLYDSLRKVFKEQA